MRVPQAAAAVGEAAFVWTRDYTLSREVFGQPIVRAFLDARVHRIRGGTNEIMRDLVGRQIVGKR